MSILIHHRNSEGVLYKTVGIITDYTDTTITLFHNGEKQKNFHPTDISTIKQVDIIQSKEIIFKEINTLTDIPPLKN